MRATPPIAIVTALLLVASAAAVPGVASAATALNVTAEQASTGEVSVDVTSGEHPAPGTTLDVTPVDPANDSYAGSGEYTTDANGTVTLPAPAADVTVVIEATTGNESDSLTLLLLAPTLDVGVDQDPATANVTVSVAYGITGEPTAGAGVNVSPADPANDSYAGSGGYTADGNGTVELPAPDEPVTVEVEGTSDGLTGSATTTLQNASTLEDEGDAENFGARVTAFLRALFGDDADLRHIGGVVAEFVVANNPGNAPGHAGPKADTGPPAHAGPSGDDDADAAGASDDDHPGADRGRDGDRGPPERAEQSGDGADAASDGEGDEDDDGDDDGPSARGGPDAGGNGQARGH